MPSKKPKTKKKFTRRTASTSALAYLSRNDLLATAKQQEVELLVFEWAMRQDDHSPRSFMLDVKKMTMSQYEQTTKALTSAQWYVRRKEIQDKITHATLQSHIGFVADMNDTHIKAAKLGLAKAIDMMTRMKIEERKDKKGNMYFVGFKPSDLKSCLESIQTAQKVQRMALGLPTSDGSITAWQTIQNERRDKTVVKAADGSIVSTTETVTTEAQVQKLSDALSYDDVRLLIEAERRRKESIVVEHTQIEASHD